MDINLKNIEVKEFSQLAAKKAKKTPILKNCIRAFLFGAGFCVIAQIFKDFIMYKGVSEEDASTYTTIFMIFLGAILTTFNVYDNIGKVAGAGSVVPVSGFANSIVSPAMEFRSEGRILGSGAQMFVVAGPVIVYGTVASVVCGAVYWILKMV
ncbi:MAG: SpoVA/SpoVAEb family sporulation membrane protein [Ruminococcaceae bacterium]|nr:SpoVA/SpoVAEb family sporulation membrane protein [Oscillospiraceae bacterium]